MAAGGFKEFVAGEVLDQDEINDYLMQGVLVFAGTAARGSAITAPVEGQFAFLKDTDQLTYYSGSAWEEFVSGEPTFDFLVIGGGGAGGGASGSNTMSGGGGAGGYRCSVSGELSGGSAVAESPITLPAGTVTVTVGAGAAGVEGFTNYPNTASDSVFSSIVSVGGGWGGTYQVAGQRGGSGGGGATFESTGANSRTGMVGIVGQGRQGGNSTGGAAANGAGGGGGGSQNVGANAATNVGGAGGAGISSSITGSAVTRGGGGGGGGATTGGAAGTGGGGAGGAGNNNGAAGSANTGGGGGGASRLVGGSNFGGNGGSGLVVIKYPDTITLTIDPGLTSSTSTAGGFKTTTFTAGTGPVVIP